jgi:hypothetical protein
MLFKFLVYNKFKLKKWSKLSYPEKLKVCQKLEAIEAKRLKRSQYQIVVKDLDESNLAGQCSSSKHQLLLDDDYFKVDESLVESRTNSTYTYGVVEEELPFLPTNSVIESTLKESSTYVINNETYYILTYEGTKPFTLVQRLLSDSESVNTTKVEGTLVDLMNGFGIYHNGVLTYCYNSVEYNIYSDVLTLDEMIELANGVEVSYTK